MLLTVISGSYSQSFGYREEWKFEKSVNERGEKKKLYEVDFNWKNILR